MNKKLLTKKYFFHNLNGYLFYQIFIFIIIQRETVLYTLLIGLFHLELMK